MLTRTKAAIAAAALTGAALVLPAVSAAALPPGDDGGGSPIERPTTTTRPPATTTTAVARRLESLSLTADSVVATATIHYSGAPSTTTVQWGDGTSTSRCPPGLEGPLHSGCLADPWSPSETAGVIVLRHQYAAPANGTGFTVAVTAQLAGESQTVAIGITPRFRVTQGTAVFRPLVDDCDTDAELYNEWRIVQSASPLPEKTWRFDWIGTVDYPLPDSQFSVEATAQTHGEVTYQVVEEDVFFDDLGVRHSIDLAPQLGTRSVVLLFDSDFGPAFTTPCRAEVRTDIKVELLRPGLGSPILL